MKGETMTDPSNDTNVFLFFLTIGAFICIS